MFIYVITAALGILVAFYIAGHLIISEPDPYQRVAEYFTILASDVAIVTLAYIFLGTTTELVLFTFTFTKCLTWSIMDKHGMVHARLDE